LLAENTAYKYEVEELRQQLQRIIENNSDNRLEIEKIPSSDVKPRLVHITTLRPLAPRRKDLSAIVDVVTHGDPSSINDTHSSIEKEEESSLKIPEILSVKYLDESPQKQSEIDEVKDNNERHETVQSFDLDIKSSETTNDRLSLVHSSYSSIHKPENLEKKPTKGFRMFGDFNPEIALKPSALRLKTGKVVLPESRATTSLGQEKGISNGYSSPSLTTTIITDQEELECREWIEKTTGEEIKVTLKESLKDGILLCK
jgi:hypothetical protein